MATASLAAGAVASEGNEAARLRRRHGRSRRASTATAWLLLAPTLLFLALAFLAPIGAFLLQAVDNRPLAGLLKNTAPALAAWDGRGLPPEAAFEGVANDLRRLAREGRTSEASRRLNHNDPGFRSLLTRTASRLPATPAQSWRATLAVLDRRWEDPAVWSILRNESGALTPHYLLATLDLRQGEAGRIEPIAPDGAIFRDLLGRTLAISAVVTLACLLAGFPVAYAMAHGSPRWRGWLLVFVLLPFWSSLLVRSAGWIILLHDQGLVNYGLAGLGFGERASQLLYKRPAVYLAMTHVLLPLMILPLYSVMLRVPALHLRAAASLGAAPLVAFRRVYLPQVLPGVIAGAALVFISALGYYITPVLVGGPRDQMVSYFIAYFTQDSANWGMGGALSLTLLGVVALAFLAIGRLIGFDRLGARA